MSNIQLPSGFVRVECKDPFCSAYFDWSAIKPFFENGKLKACFAKGYELLVITYGNYRRTGSIVRSEDLVENDRESTESDLLQGAMNFLLNGPHFRDGHDAFVYAPILLATGKMQEFSRGLVQPVAHPGKGKIWQLLGVVEKS
jgi:hypothetical protein